jgi:hypothetical protein
VTRIAFGVSLLVAALSVTAAAAQNPAVGQLPLPGHLYGYSPLVPTIDPFPSRSTGYAPSMFGRRGGKRLYYPPVRATDPVIVVDPCTPGFVGPVQLPMPARAWHRFRG